MARRKKSVFIWVGSIVGVLVTAAAIFILTLDWNRAKGYITTAVSKATGRQLLIEGDLEVDLGWISKVSASRIQFENASWSKHPKMLEVGRLDFEVDLWQLLKTRLVFPRVMISQPKVILEKNVDGKANWEFRADTVAEPAIPEDRTEVPIIENLIIKEGTLLFANYETKAEVDLRLKQAEASGFLDEPVKLKAEGSYQKQPFTLSLAGGSYQNLRSTKEVYPLQINLAVGKTRAKIDGNLTEPLAMKGEDVKLDIQGDDMANLFPLIRLVLPSTPPYRLAGHLRHEGKVWSFSKFAGRVGDSDLSGDIRVDTGQKRLLLTADLISKLLDFDDLAGFIGGTPGTKPGETASNEQKQKAAAKNDDDRLFPDQRYNLERLNAMDADVRLRAQRILAPNLPIDRLDAKLNLKEGILRFEPALFGVADGRIELYSTFDGSQRPAKIKIDTRLRQLNLKRLLGNSSFAQKTLGPIGGRVALTGTGESFRELMGTASGNTFLVMSGGQISGQLVELMGLDVAETLGMMIRGDQSVPINCALVDLHGQNGVMNVQNLVFDTADTIVFGEGAIDLRNEKLNIVLTPVPKDFSPFSLRSFIRVAGTLKKPSVFPDPLKTGTESLLAKIFNVFVILASSVVQPRDMWFGSDIDCNRLIAGVQTKDPRGLVLRDVYKTAPGKKLPSQRVAAQEPNGKEESNGKPDEAPKPVEAPQDEVPSESPSPAPFERMRD